MIIFLNFSQKNSWWSLVLSLDIFSQSKISCLMQNRFKSCLTNEVLEISGVLCIKSLYLSSEVIIWASHPAALGSNLNTPKKFLLVICSSKGRCCLEKGMAPNLIEPLLLFHYNQLFNSRIGRKKELRNFCWLTHHHLRFQRPPAAAGSELRRGAQDGCHHPRSRGKVCGQLTRKVGALTPKEPDLNPSLAGSGFSTGVRAPAYQPENWMVVVGLNPASSCFFLFL